VSPNSNSFINIFRGRKPTKEGEEGSKKKSLSANPRGTGMFGNSKQNEDPVSQLHPITTKYDLS